MLIIKSRDASVILFPTINDKSFEPSNEIILRYVICLTLIIKSRDASIILFPMLIYKSSDPSVLTECK